MGCVIGELASQCVANFAAHTVPEPRGHLQRKATNQLGLSRKRQNCSQVSETNGVYLTHDGADESGEGNHSGGENELHDEPEERDRSEESEQ